MIPSLDTGSTTSTTPTLPAYDANLDIAKTAPVTARTPEPIFQDPDDQGVEPMQDAEPTSTLQDPKATPEEVAAFVKWESYGNPEQARFAFTEALKAHADDPEWLAEFYNQLGTEKTAEMIAKTTDPATHSIGGYGGNADVANDEVAAIRESLNTLQEAGYLDENSIKAILGEFPDNQDAIAYASSEIFGKADPDVRAAFFNVAAKSDSSSWNAGALEVLNGLHSSEQQELLLNLSDGERDAFIHGAMVGERKIASFDDAVENGIETYRKLEDGEIDAQTFGGIEQLLHSANGVTVYYTGQVTVPKFTPSLQRDLFTSVAKALNDKSDNGTFDNLRDNAGFKEELSTLYMSNSDKLLHEQAPDGAFTDSQFVEGMSSFFEMTLFTQNAGSNREALMEHVVTEMSDVGNAAAKPPLSQAEYEALHGGWSQQDHVEVMGGLQGMVLQAAESQKGYLESEILADKEQRQQMIGFVTGMAFSFVPGASEVLGPLAEAGGNWLSQVPGKIAEYGYDAATSQLEEGSTEALTNLLSGAGENEESLSDVNEFLGMFKDTIIGTSAALPNGEEGELNLRTAFQSAFAFYRDLLSF